MTQDRYGNIEIDTSSYEKDPVGEFLDEKREETSESNQKKWTRILTVNSSNTGFGEFRQTRQISVLDVSVDDAQEYLDHLQEQGMAESSIHTYLVYLSTFYNRLRELGVHDANPFAYVLDETELDTSSPERDYHTKAEIGEFLKWIPEPQFQTAAILLTKTGIRSGEVCNLDLCCLHLDDDRYKEDYLDHHEVELVDEIRDRPDSIYIDENIHAGDTIRGEKRKDGNKRNRATITPIDPELKESLLNWLAIRPRTAQTSARPVFTTQKPNNGEFSRLQTGSLYSRLIGQYARDAGLAEKGKNSKDVDIHYFRHFFTTQMQKGRGDHDGGLDPMLVKYIRGDVLEDDILKTYSHDSWGVNVREEYLNNIYKFGLYD